MEQYDAIIIGTGQAGVPLARRLGEAGWKTAIIEQAAIGGTCVNYGCTPTKTMIASARMAYQARRSSEYGIHLENVRVDMPAITERKNKIVGQSTKGAQKSLEEVENIELIFGEATFTGTRSVSVTLNEGGTKELSAAHIFINTGGRTTIPEIEGIDTVNYLTSTTILDLDEIPKHLIIIGASYIALEFGQMFRRFGSEVTLLEQSGRLLEKEDEDIAEAMKKVLDEDCIAVYTNAKAKKMMQEGTKITVTVDVNGEEKTLSGTHLLIAVGRTPDTGKLNLDKAGVKTNEKGYISVNDKLETDAPGIYALGDVKGGPAFTHISYNDYLVVCKNVLDKADATIKGRLVPYCMFTDPELARVGMTEHEARKQGLNIKVAKLEMKHVARARETANTRGLMKAVVDTDSKQLLGVAILGEQGGELMSVLQMAMVGRLTYVQLREMIFAHPTYSESINNLFMTLD